MIEEKFKAVAWKCLQNNLRFEYIPTAPSIMVTNQQHDLIASIWMDDDNPSRELDYLNYKIDEYLFRQQKMTS